MADPGSLCDDGRAEWVLVTRPFPEGNERLGRLLSQVILFRAGYVFFSEISLSSLIARTSYAYFNAISNILLPENGADLTYFLEYHMQLLERAVAERHLRLTQRNVQEQAAEQEMARQPLAPQPEQMRMEVPVSEEQPYGSDPPGEYAQDEGSDVTIDYAAVKKKIQELKDGQSERIAVCSDILLDYLNQGKTTLTVVDISKSLNIDIDTAGNVITQLKQKEILESVRREGRMMVYSFRGEEVNTTGIRARRSFRRTLLRMKEKANTAIGKSADILLQFLGNGKTTFHTADLQKAMDITGDQAYKLCYQLKEKGLITLISQAGEHPNYALNFVENPAIQDEIKKTKPEYSKTFMARIEELSSSSRSTKDRRIATILTDCLSRGKVTVQDYRNAGCENCWQKDMSLAEQMGLVERFSQGCFTILQEPRPGLPELKPAQKEVASAIYNSFGEERFSSEMVIATLDYTKAHTCAILHQFTLLRILDCSTESPDKYTYQFLVNPRENPECFADVA